MRQRLNLLTVAIAVLTGILVGELAPSWAGYNPAAITSQLHQFFYGDGSDGAMVLDGTTTYSGVVTTTGSAPNFVYTLAGDIFPSSLTGVGQFLKLTNNQ